MRTLSAEALLMKRESGRYPLLNRMSLTACRLERLNPYITPIMHDSNESSRLSAQGNRCRLCALSACMPGVPSGIRAVASVFARLMVVLVCLQHRDAAQRLLPSFGSKSVV